jgi:hypothetical protein
VPCLFRKPARLNVYAALKQQKSGSDGKNRPGIVRPASQI